MIVSKSSIKIKIEIKSKKNNKNKLLLFIIYKNTFNLITSNKAAK